MSILLKSAAQAGKEIPQLATRFTPEIKKLTGQLNKLAIQETKGDRMIYTFPKATPEDLKRLTSLKMEDTYKRTTWTNPKDNKVYHLLEEGRTKDKVKVRILDKDGAFVKTAELTPKNIVIFDVFFSLRGFSHGEMMETFVKRFNPFANVERLEHKKGLVDFVKYRRRLPLELEIKRFEELNKKMEKGKKVDYVSISEVYLVDTEDVMHKTGKEQQEYVAQSRCIKELRPLLSSIMSKGSRILEAAGNDNNFAKELVSDQLAIDGIEGVGSLVKGKIAPDSCSRNSVFTQHYEKRNYRPTIVKDKKGNILGINVTGRPGAEIPMNWKTKNLPGRTCGGTSYATPVRVAKLALNDMMEGIL